MATNTSFAHGQHQKSAGYMRLRAGDLMETPLILIYVWKAALIFPLACLYVWTSLREIRPPRNEDE